MRTSISGAAPSQAVQGREVGGDYLAVVGVRDWRRVLAPLEAGPVVHVAAAGGEADGNEQGDETLARRLEEHIPGLAGCRHACSELAAYVRKSAQNLAACDTVGLASGRASFPSPDFGNLLRSNDGGKL